MSYPNSISLLCLTTKRSAYSDHFLSICNEISSETVNLEKKIYISQDCYDQSLDIVKFLSCCDFNILNYSKKHKITSFFCILQIARKIAQSEILFIYGENPYHSILAILSRLLNPKIKIYFKLADPKSHKGVNILNAFIHFLSKIILIIFSNHVIIASLNIFENASKIIVNLSKNKVNIAHFGNLIGLKKISEEIKLKEYAKRHYDLIFFGRLEKYKGIDRFLNILEIFKINNIKINALIIGSGRKIINNNLNITYINNYLSDKDFCEILNDSKIGVFLYSESTGSHVVQNTNLFGGWAVVSNVGYLKDCILKDGNGDIIERAASDYEIYEIILKRLDFINNSIISPNEVKELSISLFDNNDFSKIILNG